MNGLYKREEGRNVVDYEHIAKRLEQSEDYRVLRRLKELVPVTPREGEKEFDGIYLDNEATGLDVEKDEIIEFGAVPFRFTSLGLITRIEQPIHFYNKPSVPITKEIEEITGVTNEMVDDKSIMWTELGFLLGNPALVIAHNAGYDRPLLERYLPDMARVRWGCSMEQVPWVQNGMSGRRLEYLISEMGYFYRAHNAIADCYAGIFALQHVLQGKPALHYLLEATRVVSYRAWAVAAPFDCKDELKRRGYTWNGGEDGRPKAWSKEVTDTDVDAERQWLERLSSRCRPEFRRVTAQDRFTRRG